MQPSWSVSRAAPGSARSTPAQPSEGALPPPLGLFDSGFFLSAQLHPHMTGSRPIKARAASAAPRLVMPKVQLLCTLLPNGILETEFWVM